MSHLHGPNGPALGPPKQPAPATPISGPAEFISTPLPELGELLLPARIHFLPRAEKTQATPATAETPSDKNLIERLGHDAWRIIKFPNTSLGLGAVFACAGNSTLGMIGFAVTTLWSIKNHLNESRSSRTRPENDSPDHRPSSTLGRYLELVREYTRSPGVSNIINAAWYVVGAAQSAFNGAGWIAGAFVTSAAANCVNCHRVNANQGIRESPDTGLEKVLHWGWRQLPQGIARLAASQGPWFNASNLLFAANGINAQIFENRLGGVSFLTGAGLSAVGFLISCAPLFSNSTTGRSDRIGIYMSSAAMAALSVANFATGNVPLGVALGIWTLSNIAWVRMQRRQIASQLV